MGIKVANNAFATLAAGISNSATSITVASGQGARFPVLGAGDYFYATLINTSNQLEIVKCTARSADVLTVVRAQEATTARAYDVGDRIEIRITAATFEDATQEAAAPKLNTNNPSYTGTLTGGTGVINIGSGQLYKDASGNVGIGTSSPDYRLTNAGNLAFTNATSPTDGAGDAKRNGIGWMCTAGPTVLSAFITANNSGNFGADLSFYIRNSGGGNIIERARIANDGQQLSVIAGSGVNTLFSEFKCRAWVSFQGRGSMTIRGSGNVSSVTRQAAGKYTVNLVTAMPDTNYAAIGNANEGQDFGDRQLSTTVNSTTSFRAYSGRTATADTYDAEFIYIAAFR
jgi:hypothetical protein